MAYTTIFADGHYLNTVKKFVVDDDEDKEEIPVDQLSPGSTCYVINDKTKFTLNHSLEWVQTGGPEAETVEEVDDNG